MTASKVASSSEESLTDCDYWETYYDRHRKAVAEPGIIRTVASQYDDCWQLAYDAAGHKVKSVCEIGCYPGRHLAYVAGKYSLQAIGVDFNSDVQTIQDNFDAMGVTDSVIRNADFLKYEPQEKADFVFSIGFIEHFVNVQEVLDRHLEYLNPGGSLFISIPNMRGLIHPYKLLVDRANLRIHNLETMRLRVFKEFAARNSLTTHKLKYQNGFPVNVHQSLNLFQKLIYYPAKIVSKRLDPLIRRFPSRFYSGEMVALFTR
ncbi:MAG: SAM-dependent methyltransferase [Verrucomicrobiales bacterium]|jgi:SAM-dependent methyltransferase